MRRSARIFVICIALLGLILAGSAAAEEVEAGGDWFPVAVSARGGVAHSAEDSLARFGGYVGYLGGHTDGSAGGYYSVGASAAWVSLIPAWGQQAFDGDGFVVGPEARIGWAAGTWRREAYVYLGFNPYFMRVRSDAGQVVTGLGGRISIGAGLDPLWLFGRRNLVAYMMPNLIEVVVDTFGGGPIPRTARAGIALGWEF